MPAPVAAGSLKPGKLLSDMLPGRLPGLMKQADAARANHENCKALLADAQQAVAHTRAAQWLWAVIRSAAEELSTSCGILEASLRQLQATQQLEAKILYIPWPLLLQMLRNMGRHLQRSLVPQAVRPVPYLSTLQMGRASGCQRLSSMISLMMMMTLKTTLEMKSLMHWKRTCMRKQ